MRDLKPRSYFFLENADTICSVPSTPVLRFSMCKTMGRDRRVRRERSKAAYFRNSNNLQLVNNGDSNRPELVCIVMFRRDTMLHNNGSQPTAVGQAKGLSKPP